VLKKLGVEPEQCLYVGDGGSDELFSSEQIGMKALQAGWYLSESGMLEKRRQEQFPLLKRPSDVFSYLD